MGWESNNTFQQVFIVGPAGSLLVYNPSVGAGTLVSSIAAVAFTDVPGNAVLQGTTDYFNTGAGFVAVNINNGVITFYSAATEAGPWTAGAAISGFAAGVIGQVALVLQQSSNTAFLANADLDIQTAGRGLQIREGANARMGLATLAAGTVVVANTSVTANTRIFVFHQTSGPNTGFLSISARVAGTSFTILSSNAADANAVAWLLLEPG